MNKKEVNGAQGQPQQPDPNAKPTHYMVSVPLFQAIVGTLKKLPWEEVNVIMEQLDVCPAVAAQPKQPIPETAE